MGKKNKEPGTIDKPHLVTKFNPDWNVQVFQPDTYDEKLEKFLDDILKCRNRYLHIDDNEGLCTATSVPLGLRKIWKMGRALRVGAQDASQTYNGIPTIFKGQADKFVVFRTGPDDMKDAAKLVHVDEEEIERLGQFEYIYYDSKSMKYGQWMPPIELKEAA